MEHYRSHSTGITAVGLWFSVLQSQVLTQWRGVDAVLITGSRLDLALNKLLLHPCTFATVLFPLGAVVFTVAVNSMSRNYWKIIPLAQALWKCEDLSFVSPMIEGCILRKSQAKWLLLFSHFVHWQTGDELPQSCSEIALLKICEVQFWLLQISKILCGKVILTLFVKHLHSAEPSAMLPSYLKWCFFLDDCTSHSREEENSELKFLLGAYGKNISLQEFHLNFSPLCWAGPCCGLRFRYWQKGNVF